MRRLALAVSMLISCTPAQAPRVHRAAEVAIVAGLVGMIASGIAGGLSNDKLVAHADYLFAPVAVAGAAAYWITDGTVERLERDEAQRKLDAAFALAREAKHAARRNDCARVQALEPQVRELDLSVYRRFRRDQIIRPCLLPPPAPPAPTS